MKLWHLVFRADSMTYTICRALRECGHEVAVWIVDPEADTRPQDGIQKRIAATPGIQLFVRDPAQLPTHIDRLVIQTFPRPFDAVRDVPLLAARATRITLVSAGDRSRDWRTALKLQWLEARSLGRYAPRVDRILFKDGFHRADVFGLLRRREVVGFDAHSQFLHDPALYDLIHAENWNPHERRPLLANFLGSSDPEARTAVLDQVRHLFVPSSGGARIVRPGKAMMWHEYPDANPIGLPTQTFIETLTRSDFTLCPRGYSLVTHRPVEALLRGSIPVIAADETDLYGFELADGINCIAVPPEGWAAAVKRIETMHEDQIVTMRLRVAAMRPSALAYRQLAARICRRIGIDVQGAAA